MTDVFPDACTLPAAARPRRVAELDRLLTGALLGQERLSSTRLRWVLDATAEAAARDLAARESGCCSFLAFDISATEVGAGRVVVVDVDVPSEHAAHLDVLAALAAGAAS